MKTHLLSTLALATLPFAIGTGVSHAQVARTVYFFNASVGSGAGVAIDAQSAPWGNGALRRVRRPDYEGAPTLQILTRNFAEGVRFDLNQPIDPRPYLQNGFIRLRLKFNGAGGAGGGLGNGVPGGRGRGRGRGSFPGGGVPEAGGGFAGGGAGAADAGGGVGTGALFQMRPPADGGDLQGGQDDRGDNPDAQAQGQPPFDPNTLGGALPGLGGATGFPAGLPGAFPGTRGGTGGATAGTGPQATYIKEFKITLVRETGVTSGRFVVDLNTNRPDDNGWHLFTLALKDMTSSKGAAGAITRVLLTSDAQDTFSLAQMALVMETGQMTVSLRTADQAAGTQTAEVTARPDQPLLLVADVEAGAADPQVEWNFDADNVGLPRADAGLGTARNPNAPATGIPGAPFPGAGGIRPATPRTGVGTGATGGGRGTRTGGTDGTPGTGAVFLGPRIDARGLTASATYPNEEQDYRVEVTVRDRSGQRPPVKASMLIHVRG